MRLKYKATKLSIASKLIPIFLILLGLSLIFLPEVSAQPAADILVDSVNIDGPIDEAGHNLLGWGPIVILENKPKGGKNKPNGGNDDNLRYVWYNDSKNPSDIPTISPDENWATLNLSTGEDYVATKMEINVLDGKNDESFDTYVNDNLVYSYTDDDKSPKEKWKLHNIDISNMELLGTLSVKIVATGEKPKNFDNSGQLGIGEIQLYAIKTTLITVILKDSNNNSLSDGYVEYYYDDDWQEIGLTNEFGEVSKRIPDGRYEFRMTYVGASITKVQDIRIDPVIEFSTLSVTVSLKDSLNNSLPNGNVSFHGGSWQYFGLTNESGIVTKELLPRSYTFKMTYEGAYISKRQDIRINPVILFSTIEATVKLEDSSGNLLEGGNVSYHAGGWKHFGITNASGVTKKEVLPRTYTFRMKYDGAIVSKGQDVSVDPLVNFSTIKVTVKFNDSLNNPIAGGNVSYNAGGWREFGITNDNGSVYKEVLPRAYSFRMKFNGAIVNKRQDIKIDPLVNFSTVNVTVNFNDSTNNSISGGIVTYHSGGWKDFGVTDENGTAYKEILPRAYTFRMKYDDAIVSKRQDIRIDPIVNFSTIGVAIRFEDSIGNSLSNGTVKYNSGGWKTLGVTNNSGELEIELLPRSYYFQLDYDGTYSRKTQDIIDNSTIIFSTINVTIKFLDSTNNPIEGGIVSYHCGGWKSFGVTNNLGEIKKELMPRIYTFKLSYDGTAISKKQDIRNNATVVFSTIGVAVRLQDSKGNPLSGGNVSYNSGGWKTFGTTNESGEIKKELMPISYRFKMTYDGVIVYKTQNIVVNSTVLFSTIEVTVRFQSSNGSGIPGGNISCYTNKWVHFGYTNESGEVKGELLSRSYTFKLKYDGTYITKKQDIGIDPVVVFSTVKVTVKLQDGSGNPLSNGVARYVSGGWKDFGITNESGAVMKELLPRTYSFNIRYDNASVSKRQNVNNDPVVIFSLVNVTAKVEDKYGSPIENATIYYYAGGQKTFGIANVNGTANHDLLPRAYTFRAIYNRTRITIRQNVGSNSTLLFKMMDIVMNYPPTAVSDGPYNGSSNETIEFNASGSYDPDGLLVNYTWEFGDEAIKYGLVQNHTYSKDGEYFVNLTVIDDYGLSSTNTTKAIMETPIIVEDTSNQDNNSQNDTLEPSNNNGNGGRGNNNRNSRDSDEEDDSFENLPPIAKAIGPAKSLVNDTLLFDASGSFDPDGDTLQYRWDFNNDGNWDTEFSTEPTVTYKLSTDFSGVAVVQVYDGEETDEASIDYVVEGGVKEIETVSNEDTAKKYYLTFEWYWCLVFLVTGTVVMMFVAHNNQSITKKLKIICKIAKKKEMGICKFFSIFNKFMLFIK